MKYVQKFVILCWIFVNTPFRCEAQLNPNTDIHSATGSAVNGLFIAQWNARCLSVLRPNFDINIPSQIDLYTNKPVVQLLQESCGVFPLGGNCKFLLPQPQVSSFIDQNKSLLVESTKVPSIGLLTIPSAWTCLDSNNVILPEMEDLVGLYKALSDGGLDVDIVPTNYSLKRIWDYPVIVVPNWNSLDKNIADTLSLFTRRGGKLLVVGTNATQILDSLLGVNPLNTPQLIDRAFFNSGYFGRVRANWLQVKALTGTREYSYFYNRPDLIFMPTKYLVSTIRSVDKGSCSGIYVDLGGFYHTNKTPIIRDLLLDIMKEMRLTFPSIVEGTSSVSSVLRKTNSSYLLSLQNCSGNHANTQVRGYDYVPPLFNLGIQIFTKSEPTKLILHPKNDELPFDFKDGITHCVLPRMDLHATVEAVLNTTKVEIHPISDVQVIPIPIQNYSKVQFELTATEPVKINVYSSTGILLFTILDSKLQPGFHSFEFGSRIAVSGLYFVVANIGAKQMTKKIIRN